MIIIYQKMTSFYYYLNFKNYYSLIYLIRTTTRNTLEDLSELEFAKDTDYFSIDSQRYIN